MTTTLKPIWRLALISLFVSAGLLLVVAAQAQQTTSSLRVSITDQAGNSVGSVAVRITHVPTDRSISVTSNDAGVATARGLAVGGPYEVEIADTARFAADVQQNIYLDLDQTATIAITVRPVVEEIVVTAQAMTEELSIGFGGSFSRAEIDATPSIGRDFTSTLARDPSILVDNSVPRGPVVSMAGQNYRYNSVTIDGVAQNDNFGLQRNASATSRAPISIDAVESISVNMAPYDVSFGNFIGGNINIVTKSGTNDFHGSAFYFKTDESLTGNKSDGASLGLDLVEEDTYGFTLGGPIIKDKLFFFANYEKFETEVPANAVTIDQIPGVTQAEVDRVREVADRIYGFDPGPFATTDTDEDEKALLKIDWYINDDHRAVASYQTAKTDVLFDDFPTLAALNSNRYNINQDMTAISVHLFSNWTDRLSTELKLGFKEVERRDVSVDGSVPMFVMTAAGGTDIHAGGDMFRMANELDNETDAFRIKADYEIGDHVLTAGFEYESKTVRNQFIPFSKGMYLFFDIDSFEARFPFGVVYGNSNTGITANAEANFTLDVSSFYVQDEWTPTDDLTLTFGVRYDELSNDDPIADNSDFEARHLFKNTENLDGKSITLPRFGFHWTPSDRLTIRGGAGLFGGGAPLIILSNSYSGDGINRTFSQFISFFNDAPGCDPCEGDAVAAAAADLPDPTAAFTHLQPFIGSFPTAQVDAINPSWDIMSTWKYSLGAEYLADLSGIGMGDDWLFSADVILSEVKDGYDVRDIRRFQVDTAPDGRPIYNVANGTNNDFVAQNTGSGDGTVVSLTAAKSWDTRAGMFDMSLGYTHTEMDEIRSYNRFVAFETLVYDPGTDMNDPQIAPSRYEVPDRVTATLTWNKELFGNNMSTLGLVYIGRSGRHFSYVFGSANTPVFGGSEFADWGSENVTAGTQLFYVPTGPGDANVFIDPVLYPTFEADLNEFIDSTDCLSAHRGSSTTRNNCATSWTNVVNLRLMQEISFGDRINFDLMLDIENFGNLINSDWGRVEHYIDPGNVSVANVIGISAADEFILTPNVGYDPSVGASSVVARPTIGRLQSAYRIQFGVRFRF